MASQTRFTAALVLAAALLLPDIANAAFVGPARCAASRVATPRMGSTADFKTGLTIEFEDQVWKVTEFLHVKPGKGSAFVRSKLKNLQTGQTLGFVVLNRPNSVREALERNLLRFEEAYVVRR